MSQEEKDRQPYYIEQLKQLYESTRHDDKLANLIASYYYAVFVAILGGAIKLYFEKPNDTLQRILGGVFIVFFIIGMGLLLILIKNNKSKWRFSEQIEVIQQRYLIDVDKESFQILNTNAEGKKTHRKEGDVIKIADIYTWIIFIIQSIVLTTGFSLVFKVNTFYFVDIFQYVCFFVFASILNLLLTFNFLQLSKLEDTYFEKKLKELLCIKKK
jgi:hypothetical protein